MSLITDVETLIKPPIEALGAVLETVSLSLEHGEHVLHVSVSRKDGPLDLDFIVAVSEAISPLLDESNLIDHHYTLDVSSAGAERPIPIARLGEYIGRYIHVHLRKPYKGENGLDGTLTEANETSITLKGHLKGQAYQIQISIADVDKVRLAIKF